jgi:hypothetical protein
MARCLRGSWRQPSLLFACNFRYQLCASRKLASYDRIVMMIWRGCKKLGIWNKNQKLFNPSRFLMIRIAASVPGYTLWHILNDYCLEGCEAMQPVPGALYHIQKEHNLHVIRFIKVIYCCYTKCYIFQDINWYYQVFYLCNWCTIRLL